MTHDDSHAPDSKRADTATCDHEWEHIGNQFDCTNDPSKKFPRIADVTHRVYRCQECRVMQFVPVGAQP